MVISLLDSPIQFCLCKSQKSFNKKLKKLKVYRYSYVNHGKGATTHFFEKKGVKKAIVCISPGCSKIQRYALLVHEAVHIWQEIVADIGENKPSEEFEAYVVQRIAQALFVQEEKK